MRSILNFDIMFRRLARICTKRRSFCRTVTSRDSPAVDRELRVPPNLNAVADNLRARGESLDVLRRLKTALSSGVRADLRETLRLLPNDLHPSVDPNRSSPIVISQVGAPRKFPDGVHGQTFEQLAVGLDGFLWDDLTLICGQRSYAFKNELADLEWALIRRTVDYLRNKCGFHLVSVPDVIHPHVVEGCGFAVEGERTQVYFLDNGDTGTCLSGTGEMGIAAMLENQTIPAAELPLKLATVSRCYRAEVSGLKGEKGLYRVHQFNKVEMFCVGKNSDQLVEEILRVEQELFEPLGLHYKILDMPACDLGSSAARKFDIEAWMPAKKRYGEISSCSSCTDYQTRRLNIVCDDGEPLETANGTACAVPRLMIALLETHQNAGGSVTLPEVLVPHMKGVTELTKPTMKLKHVWIRSLSDSSRGRKETVSTKKKISVV